MLVRDVMSKSVITVSPQETLEGLITTFLTHNFHTLPVVDSEKRIAGIVNFKDIMKIFIPHNPALEKLLKSTHFYRFEEEDILEADLPEDLGHTLKVADIMNVHVVSIDESETVAEARHLMRCHNITRMPVTKDRELVGFITLFDLIVAIFRERGIIR